MDHNRSWNCLGWNVRGINSQPKWDAIHNKILESCCAIVCLQETKREQFDQSYLKHSCHSHLDRFEFSPSVGASGGLITIWNDRLFEGELVSFNLYLATVKLTSHLSGQSLHVTNIYVPSTSNEKAGFISWLYNFDTSSIDDRIILGDFNLIRSPENRSWLGGSTSEMLLFNDVILHLDLVEIGF
jgi:exonuclease III